MSKDKTENTTDETSDSAQPEGRKAVALRYHSLEELPVISALGAGAIAEQILDLAAQYSIPISENSSLLEALEAARLGEAIDPQAFTLTAEVLSFLYHVDKEWREKHKFMAPVMHFEESDESGDPSPTGEDQT